MLEIKNLSVTYDARTILNNISFSVKDRQWLMVVGPNGAGKSTLLNAISKGAPYTGKISIDGVDISKIKNHQIAKKMGILMQNNYVSYSFTVEDIVRLGRYAYTKNILSGISDEDNDKIYSALESTGMLPLKDQSVLTLSGGELQRTFLAQLLAQDPELLLLDEPTNHLDLVYQKQIFELIKNWIDITGRSVISVVHDLSLAKAYGTDAVLLENGELIAQGDIHQTLSLENLNKTYKIDIYNWMNNMLSQWRKEVL